MDIYVLDNALRRTSVVDSFESLIWTERFSAWGDFELAIYSTPENRSLLGIGSRLAINDSARVMTIETAESKTNDDGKFILTVTGRSIETVLEDRTAAASLLSSVPVWDLTDTPANIARTVFTSICVDGLLDPSDKIPFITTGNIFPIDTIPEPEDIINVKLKRTTVYDAVKQLCDLYNLGFRLVRDKDTSKLYFNVYSGSDRTATQDDLAPVIFSPSLDNLSDISELTSVAQFKNVAYVFAPNGTEVVYDDSANPLTAGFERRVLTVDASDITDPAGAELTAALIKRGKDELAKNKSLSAFDGEIPQNGKYKYGLHYQLGDLVEMRNTDGMTNNMRVTEQIFVSDAQGDRSYPTLAIDLFITPGSWYAWDFNQVWDEADGFWEDA